LPLAIAGKLEESRMGVNFFVQYVGPLGGVGTQKSVKVDISRSERLVFEPIWIPALVQYRDLPAHDLLCYTLAEILIEKLRSVIQRMQPRDLYDIWFLLEIYKMDVSLYYMAFNQKCNFSGIDPLNFLESLKKRMPLYKARWKSSLMAQMKDLPDFESVERETLRQRRGLR
jgi:predicted nucleotidyltransferase component of viral defense system